MNVVHDRPQAKWLPSRHRFALFRLYALLRDADAVIHLGLEDSGRNVRILKYRGSDFQPGNHSMRLTSHGIHIFPNAA